MQTDRHTMHARKCHAGHDTTRRARRLLGYDIIKLDDDWHMTLCVGAVLITHTYTHARAHTCMQHTSMPKKAVVAASRFRSTMPFVDWRSRLTTSSMRITHDKTTMKLRV